MTQGDTKHSRSVKLERSRKNSTKNHKRQSRRNSRDAKEQKSQRPRSLDAQFDPKFNATANGGAALAEKTMRSLALRRYTKKYLPARSENAQYLMEDAVHALMAGLMVGGRGIQAAEALRDDELLSKIFGLVEGAQSPTTTYRVLCELAGLSERKVADYYVESGDGLPSLDMFGQPREKSALRRVVPETPEAATPGARDDLDQFTAKVAVRCATALPRNVMRLFDWFVAFGDATDLEVEGKCFDAARVGYNGKKILRWQTLMLGPILAAQQLHEGNIDEGVSMPRLLEMGSEVVREALGAKALMLCLLDAAYFEKQVIDLLTDALRWDFIACANQYRDSLRRRVEEQPDYIWEDTGADTRRGWSKSQVCCFLHMPEGWNHTVNIIVRRWIEEGDIDTAWHYSFLGTRIEPGDIPQELADNHSYPSAIWMLYSTKQGHENHYKTPLRDFGLHHPPSCRLGVDQAFYAIATAASNIAAVMRYRVVATADIGIAFWRLRQKYFRIAGQIVTTGRRLTVWLSGANVGAQRQVLWEHAFAAAGRL
jgi:hypothetical protein